MLSGPRAALVAAAGLVPGLVTGLVTGLAIHMVTAGIAVGSPAAAPDGIDAIVVADPRLTESSGLAVSPHDSDLLYTVNDSGHKPVVYVIDRSGGASSKVVGTTVLAGVERADLDPEALATGADDTLWVADIGDNAGTRTDIALYALPAPGRGMHTVTPVRYPIVFPRGLADDAETLVADPGSGRMWVVTKGWLAGAVFELPDPLAPGRPNELRLVPDVDAPLLVTDGTALAGGDAAVLRTYVSAVVYTLPDWRRVGGFRLPGQPQGEALAALRSAELLAGSEGTPTRIDRVTVPPELVAGIDPAEPGNDLTARPRPGQTGAGAATAVASEDGTSVSLVIGVIVGAVVVAAAGMLSAHRRRGGR